MNPESGSADRRRIAAWFNPYHYDIERWAYTFQRLSGIAILLYVLGHIGDTSFFVGGPLGSGPSQSSWSGDMAVTENIFGHILLTMVVLVVVFHGVNGIRLILSEYGIIFQKPSRPEYPYRAKSQRAIQRHLIWLAIVAAIVASLWTAAILFG